jgi:hypothetical protein
VHVQAGLLHCKRKIRARDDEVHERASQASVVGGVIDRRAVGGQLPSGVDQSGHGFAICHTRALEDVLSLVFLGEVEVSCGSLDVDAKEETQFIVVELLSVVGLEGKQW